MEANETETLSCDVSDFKKQVKEYDRLALLVVGQASEAAQKFADHLSLSELDASTAVLVAEGDCSRLLSYLEVRQTPSIIVLEHGVKRGEIPISGDFERDVARLKELCL